MYHGKHETKRTKRRHRSNKKALTLFFSLLLIGAVAVGGTLAYLVTQTDPVNNTFLPSHVSCQVEENFNNATGVKSNVTVKNTGDTEAYIRVKLVTYRTNDQGQHIGGTAELPSFNPGTNWVRYGDFYYYTKPVAPNETPENALIDSITLTSSYPDADGGKQAIDVMAEAIQSGPATAIGEAWGVSITTGSVSAYQG